MTQRTWEALEREYYTHALQGEAARLAFWDGLTPHERLDLVVNQADPVSWYSPESLAALAAFRTNAQQWSWAKQIFKQRGGFPPDLEKTVDAHRRSAREEASASPALAPAQTPYSDVYNAEAFIADHGEDLRYCPPWGAWLLWTGTHWRKDDTGQLMQRARLTAKRLVREAVERDDEKLLKHAVRTLSHDKLTTMTRQAQTLEGVPVLPDACDQDLWLLNCLNGTLDLRTGVLRAPQRQDLLTKCLPIAYDMQATCPTWDRFLWRIMGGSVTPDSEDDSAAALEAKAAADARAQRLIGFLQRAIGYALTGVTNEDCLFLLHGPGRNGKSRFLDAIHALLGSYAKTADMRTFMMQERETVRNDLADLYSVRCVSASETQEGKRFSEGLVKQLTGGDRIKARFLFEEYFEFIPQFKLFLAFNHKPLIRGTDLAIWERIRLIPFTVTIPPEERDKDLASKLRAELPGILAWAVRGCLVWRDHGLQPPPEVIEATQDYRKEMDTIERFLEECCLLNAGMRTKATPLYKAYVRWCEEGNETPVKQTAFGLDLSKRSIESVAGTANVTWRVGIGLRADESEQ